MTALTDAIVPVLAAAGVPVGVGRKPANVGARPWVVLWPDVGRRFAVTMKANDGVDETWTCHCVGLTETAAAVAARKLTDAVYSLHREVVAGRLVQWPEQFPGPPLSRDDDVDPPIYTHTVEWRFTTTPA